MRRKASRLATIIFGALVGGALLDGGACENPVPVRPSYARDIAPLMTARCTRCHSSGNPTDPDMQPIVVTAGQPGITKAIGDFTTMAGAESGCAPVLFNTFVIQTGMPPPPSDKLDAWSIELLQRWCANPQP
jgi:hypothetical protein